MSSISQQQFWGGFFILVGFGTMWHSWDRCGCCRSNCRCELCAHRHGCGCRRHYINRMGKSSMIIAGISLALGVWLLVNDYTDKSGRMSIQDPNSQSRRPTPVENIDNLPAPQIRPSQYNNSTPPAFDPNSDMLPPANFMPRLVRQNASITPSQPSSFPRR